MGKLQRVHDEIVLYTGAALTMGFVANAGYKLFQWWQDLAGELDPLGIDFKYAAQETVDPVAQVFFNPHLMNCGVSVLCALTSACVSMHANEQLNKGPTL